MEERNAQGIDEKALEGHPIRLRMRLSGLHSEDFRVDRLVISMAVARAYLCHRNQRCRVESECGRVSDKNTTNLRRAHDCSHRSIADAQPPWPLPNHIRIVYSPRPLPRSLKLGRRDLDGGG